MAVVVVTPTAHLSAYLTLSMTGRLVQPENASLPMEVTESGMVIPVRLEQLANAEVPMVVTELPIVAFCNLEQPLNV